MLSPIHWQAMPAADQHSALRTIVFDIGGTWLRSARFRAAQGLDEVQVRPAISLANHQQANSRLLKDCLLDYLVDTANSRGASRCGVSLGASLNTRGGQRWGSNGREPDLPGELARRAPHIRWHVVHDITSSLLHYVSQPAHLSQGLRKIMLVTLNNSIACRTLDLRTHLMPLDSVGPQHEFGHWAVAPVQLDERRALDLPCECGAHNHLAAFSSGRGLHNLHRALRHHDHERWTRSTMAGLRAAGMAHEEALALALASNDLYATNLLRLSTRPMADALRCALAMDPEIDRMVLTGGLSINLNRHYLRALERHFQDAGLYLTSRFDPGYIMNRITLAAPGSADGLYGAGLYALAAERPLPFWPA
ncbi:glucose kinase [Pseudomonas sp. M47T1]|uniref:ROK family protein n=1 Tax=Pseudomonas sp. M47T1 TaxID=1179778 RepID=UPI0002606F1F|nr:ROK family protein [Pseudomonas sp. M47T1]EIK96614.1 glucose kinase [Pseudomonas sp. M47T1]